MFFGNIFILIYNKVLYNPNDKFTYFNDISNSLCLTFLYFLSYFLSGYYPIKFDEFIYKGIDKEMLNRITQEDENRKKYNLLLIIIGVLLFCIGFGAGYSFYSVAKSNVNAYWIYNLNNFGRVYYCLFLGITWYHSLSLLGMALVSSFLVYLIIKNDKLNYIDNDFNKNISVISAVDIVLSTFSYGLFYIIGGFLFIFNDRIAEKYKVYNMFYKDVPSFILILVITLLVIWAYLPLHELLFFMKKKKDCFISNLNESISREELFEQKEQLILKRNDLIRQNLIYTSVTNKIIFIISVIVPLMGVIFQAIDLFGK